MALDFGPFVLGGNVFGWTANREESFRVLDAFVERGGKAIDTADVYSEWIPGNKGGESETIIGEWQSSRGLRSKIVIATKVAKWSAHPGLSSKNIRAAVEGSLKRLRTDFIDLYYAHEDDKNVEQAEYLATFDALVKEGKVRTLGASNFEPARLSSAIAFSKKHGLATFEIAQDQWSLVERDVETEHVPVLAREDVRELPYWSLANGFLTGKYRPGQTVDSSRAQAAGAYLQVKENLELLGRLDALAAEHETSVTAIALAWLRAQSVVAAPIASARVVDHLDALFDSASVSLSKDAVDSLSAITARSAFKA